MKTRFASATCPNCQTLFDRLPVDGDEDGNFYVAVDARPCGTCGQMLCGCCEQFTCECGAVHCFSHLVIVPDGTPGGLKCCAACAAECEPLELPACAWCDLAVSAGDSSVQRSGDLFHVACFNEFQAWTREEAEAFDDAQSFPRHEDAAFPARRAPGRALRIVARGAAEA